MSNRAKNMRRVSATRSAEVQAMLALLLELDNGTGGDFDGFSKFGIQYSGQMKGRINSYRAQKIAKYLGKNISKGHLVDLFAKKKKNLEGNQANEKMSVDEFIEMNGRGLSLYWQYSKGFYINKALRELDKGELNNNNN
jgi:Ca2+-binding EF-hand superfamily protein